MVFDPYPPPNDIPFNPATQKSPVYEAPALSTRVIPNQLVIVYGAGDSDDILDRVRLSFLTSVTEGPDPDNVTKWKVTQNWVKYYASAYGGEKLMGPPIVFASAAMCVTFAPDPNQPCQGGNGTVWGFDYWKPGKAGAAPVAALDADCDPKTVDLTDHLSLGTAVPYGVTVVRRPVCYNGQPSDGLDANDLSVPKFGSGKQAKPTVVVQTGIKDTTGGNPAPPAGTTQPKVPTKELTNLGGTPATMFATSWGFVFD
jgi:hypothetical protein